MDTLQTNSARHATHGCVPQYSSEALLMRIINSQDYPCVGAKAALARGGIQVLSLGSMASCSDDRKLYAELIKQTRIKRDTRLAFRSLAAVFSGPCNLDEPSFEDVMWQRLSALTKIDEARGYSVSKGFSFDPLDPNFALSFGEKAYFAVALHPQASRSGRRSPVPMIIFNSHEQFAELRRLKKYERMRQVILARDAAINGTINPMIARHGEVSEARQYSGRLVGADWACPMKSRGGTKG